MGGKALKNAYTRRYNAIEFKNLVEEILPVIRKEFNTEAEVIVAYKNKESFGDIDILIKNNSTDVNIILENIERIFNPTQIHRNTDCISFDYKEIQIDFILTTPENWEISQIFFSYNDLGNLQGKIAHRFGLKYGYDGLKIAYYTKDDKIKKLDNIYISRDARKIFQFLGFDYDRYLLGFDNLNDIFDYVIDSKYFDPEVFKMEHLNNIDRSRNKKRANYQIFLDYIKDKSAKTKWINGEDKSKYVDEIHDFFNPPFNLKSKISELEEKEKLRREIKSKFNGNLIMEWVPEYKGNRLGKIMLAFSQYIEKEHKSFDEWLSLQTDENIKKQFLKFSKDFKDA